MWGTLDDREPTGLVKEYFWRSGMIGSVLVQSTSRISMFDKISMSDQVLTKS